MKITSINAELLAKMFLAGAKNLDAKKDWINELNVFPVPDGDTGTNMSMTIMSAAKAVSDLENPTMAQLSKAISSGSLRGARGNSGVILSQLFRGFCKVIKEYDEVDVIILTEAVQKAVETAYKAVMKPKEGTILTVAKGAADKATEISNKTDDIVEYLEAIVEEADYVLSKTPDMLPVLKQAGVVDSGGQGLVQVLKGAYDALIGKEFDYSLESEEKASEEKEEIKFVYRTEFVTVLDRPLSEREEKEFKLYLETIGDSVVVVADDKKIKVSVHTNAPGHAIQKALDFGSLTNVQILNLKLEDEKTVKATSNVDAPVEESKASEEPAMEHKDMGFIAVSVGEGVNEIFKSLGADYIISGGQTMNPSTDDVLSAVEKVNADHVFVLPNNKNIIMAAKQAAEICEDKEIIVIPTKTIPQGITALVNFIPELSAEDNKETMLAEIENVKTGQVTYAVRDTEIDGKEIKKNDYMGIGDKTILAVGQELEATTIEMTEQMIDEDSAMVSIYVGKEAKMEDAEKIASIITEKHSDLEVEINQGDQPIYYYIISVE
ncbi:hypothetical protein SAMN04487761_11221 [Lachnospiraceae bacterium C7]|nr:hypothetical protein SAMN04487761_11221 [Lachnospiraceae bacterium C7]